MKFFFKIILKYYLKYITKTVLFLHQPKIVAVCGSINKTFVRDEIVRNFKKEKKSVRANPKNFNTEIGLPLAILNVSSGYNSYRGWISPIIEALKAVFQKKFPKYLVLEFGISQKGDMKYLLSIVSPKIFVITDITQRYVELFSGMDELFEEYEYLAEKISKNDWLVLNYDNIKIRELAKRTLAKVVSFGEQNFSSEWRIAKIEKNPQGQKVSISYQGKEKKYQLNRFGKHHAFALVASLAVKNIRI